MKKIVFILTIVFALSSIVATATPGKPAGKHKSHKKAKKKKSGYMFDFQH